MKINSKFKFHSSSPEISNFANFGNLKRCVHIFVKQNPIRSDLCRIEAHSSDSSEQKKINPRNIRKAFDTESNSSQTVQYTTGMLSYDLPIVINTRNYNYKPRLGPPTRLNTTWGHQVCNVCDIKQQPSIIVSKIKINTTTLKLQLSTTTSP